MKSAVIVFTVAVAVLLVLRVPIARAARLTASQTPSVARQNDGEVAQTLELSSFHGLVLNGSIDFIVKVGKESKVVWYCTPETLAYLDAKVENGILTVGQKEGIPYDKVGKVRAYVETPALDEVTIDGSSDASIENIGTDHFRLALNGSGNIVVIGKAATGEFLLDGSGNLALQSLDCDSARVAISGSGDATVSASKLLEAHVAGSGNVHYMGNPTVKSEVAGSGKIIQG